VLIKNPKLWDEFHKTASMGFHPRAAGLVLDQTDVME